MFGDELDVVMVLSMGIQIVVDGVVCYDDGLKAKQEEVFRSKLDFETREFMEYQNRATLSSNL